MQPETFQRELTTRMGPQYRLIRSLSGPRWRVEQKVNRAFDYPATDDRARMLRDGYHLVLETGDSDTMRCPACEAQLSLPVFERAEFACPRCAAHGRRKRLVGGYFPLVDKTLLYLERYHPRRGRAIAQELADENRRVELAKQRETRNLAEDLALDAWGRVSGAVQIGRTKAGTPHTWGGTPALWGR